MNSWDKDPALPSVRLKHRFSLYAVFTVTHGSLNELL